MFSALGKNEGNDINPCMKGGWTLSRVMKSRTFNFRTNLSVLAEDSMHGGTIRSNRQRTKRTESFVWSGEEMDQMIVNIVKWEGDNQRFYNFKRIFQNSWLWNSCDVILSQQLIVTFITNFNFTNKVNCFLKYHFSTWNHYNLIYVRRFKLVNITVAV